MTAIGELLGLGAPADQERIRADLDLIRRHGLDALRTRIHGAAVPADLYIAVIAQLAYRHPRHEPSAEEQLARLEAADERRQISRGGNR